MHLDPIINYTVRSSAFSHSQFVFFLVTIVLQWCLKSVLIALAHIFYDKGSEIQGCLKQNNRRLHWIHTVPAHHKSSHILKLIYLPLQCTPLTSQHSLESRKPIQESRKHLFLMVWPWNWHENQIKKRNEERTTANSYKNAWTVNLKILGGRLLASQLSRKEYRVTP